VRNAILQWRADDLENAAAEAGIVIAKVRTFDEFRKELQYTEVLSRMPLISVEKIGESEPLPFKKNGTSPLDGIRALGMGHVIAGAAIGRTSLCTGQMSSIPGGRTIARSKRSRGTHRSECAQQSWTTRRRIARDSITC
jgi:hypothetical protein